MVQWSRRDPNRYSGRSARNVIRAVGIRYPSTTFASALRIANEGGTIAIIDIADDGGASTVAEIERCGGTAFAIECDVAEPERVGDAISSALGPLGGLDVLINCAGTGF